MATRTPPKTTPPKTPKGGGNVFTRKLGPLPAWVWMAIVGGLVLLYVVYEYHNQSQQQTGSTAANTNPPMVFEFPPENDSGSGKGSDDDDKKKKKPKPKSPPDKHPKAFHIKKGQHSPTTERDGKTWVYGHYGPQGAYHPGHYEGSGAVPQPHHDSTGKRAHKAHARHKG